MPPKSKLAACVNCRQMKLKCDAHELFPAACTRCDKQGLRCSIDPSFRRTAKRERFKALEEEVERLQSHQTFTASPNTSASIEPETNGLLDAIEPEPFSLPETVWVGDVEVATPTIWELFDIYYEHYHPRFPVLQGKDSLIHWYNKSTLLLGVILSIAAGQRPQFTPLRDKLIAHVQRSAMDTVGAARHPSLTVQALLLISWWPLSLDASVLNPSWAYCGLATHTALQFGLHRSNHPSDFVYKYVPDEYARAAMKRTWLACFIVNQSVSAHLGVPSTVPIDHSIISAVGTRDTSLPLIMQQYLDIAYHDYQLNQTLGNSSLSSTGQIADPSSLVQSYDRDLHMLNLKYRTSWNNATEIALLKARLNLYSFACCQIFSSKANHPTTTRIEPTDTSNISEAERCAERIITLGSQELSAVEQASSDVRGAMTTSIFFLLKLSATKHPAVNHALARDSLRQAWSAFRHASIRNTDQYARICAILEYMSGVGGQDPAFMTSMTVESRMAANISYDTAWAARARFPKHVQDARPIDYTAAAESQQAATKAAALVDHPEDLLMDHQLMADLFGSDLLGWDFGELQGL